MKSLMIATVMVLAAASALAANPLFNELLIPAGAAVPPNCQVVAVRDDGSLLVRCQ